MKKGKLCLVALLVVSILFVTTGCRAEVSSGSSATKAEVNK